MFLNVKCSEFGLVIILLIVMAFSDVKAVPQVVNGLVGISKNIADVVQTIEKK